MLSHYKFSLVIQISRFYGNWQISLTLDAKIHKGSIIILSLCKLIEFSIVIVADKLASKYNHRHIF